MTFNTELWNTQTPGAAGGYEIERSLRFNSADNSFLNRTPASAGNRKTWTWSGWVKLSRFLPAGETYIFGSYSGGNDSDYLAIYWLDTGKFRVSAWTKLWLETTQVFRDFSAWGHLVIVADTGNATADNRIRIYWNGVQITSFSTRNNPGQNDNLAVNAAAAHQIGAYPYNPTAQTFGGYLADVHFVDGQALDPTSFGEFDDNGIWQPIEYTGTYGTNGFRLTFGDNSTTAALGNDDSPNSNTWAVNNFSVAAGSGNDSLVDVPINGDQTDTGSGGQVRGNYCTLNPLDSARTLSNGNLEYAGAASGIAKGSIAVSSGKWYWECQRQGAGNSGFGICAANEVPSISYLGATATSYAYTSAATKYNNGSSAAYGATYSTTDIIGVALDLDAGTLTFYKNNASQGIAYSSLSGTFVPACGNNSTTDSGLFNFGQRPFAYTAPSGFKALNTANLPAPVVTKPSTVMDVKVYPGNGSTQTISGLGFSPDFTWIKVRNGTVDHVLYDQVRGVQKYLSSNTTGAEGDQTGTPNVGLYAFTSDGFSVGDVSGGSYGVNGSSGTYVAWAWDAGTSTVTNTQGSITSSVRANPSAGFSIVTYTGTGSAATVGHGLGVAPSLVLVKIRSQTGNWQGYHASLGKNYTIKLNTTEAQENIADYWGAGGVTSSVVGLIGGGYTTNVNGATHVAYCFAPVAGYSAFGSYTGNGSADGPFVFCNFRPRWLLIKLSSSSGGDWVLFDSARNTYNLNNEKLAPNSSYDENNTTLWGPSAASQGVDFLSNGFKLRNTAGGNLNGTGLGYIYAAFAESPFQYARAR
jgi:hypothetical protein